MTNKNLNPQISLNTHYIDYAKSLYNDKLELTEKINLIDYIVYFATLNVTKRMSDSFLESKLEDISNSINFELYDTFEENSILHVVTEAYETGGHTQLLKMFIENTSEHFSKQSVLAISQIVEFPSEFESFASKHGDITLLDNTLSKIQKAQQLAKIASKHHYIVLHIHPHEIVANLAFANSNFKRPVIFLNHADHMFWCGVGISDIVLDLSSQGSEFSSKIRGVAATEVIQIPIKDKQINISKEEAREYLNIDKNKKIILSIASEYKYGTSKDEIFRFVNMGINIIKNVDNCEFILIGPNRANKYWDEAYEISNKKINPIGIQDRKLLDYYIAASDLYIESFPFASYTALLETALYDISILSLKTPTFTMDTVKDSDIIVYSVKELEDKAIRILNNEIKNMKKIDLTPHFKENWQKNIIDIFSKQVSATHKANSFSNMEVDTIYLNHIYSIVHSNTTIFGQIYQKLSEAIKLKLLYNMKKFNIIKNYRFMFKLFRKIIKGFINGK